jgi:homoserine kinase type II
MVLTIADEKSFRDVNNLGELLLHLEAQQFDTTRICLTTQGEISVAHENRPVFIKHFVEGYVDRHPGERVLEQAGHCMAILHGLPLQDYISGEHSYGLQEFPTVFEKAVDSEYELWLAEKYETFKKMIDPGLPKGLIHGDLFYDNLLMQDGQFKTFIDFEEACHYYRIFDIGMAIVGLCSENGTINLSRVDRFVTGYQEISPLKDAEKSLLKLFAEYAAVATSFWRFRQYRIVRPSSENRNKHHEMMGLANAIMAIPDGEFIDSLFPGVLNRDLRISK